MIFFITNFVFFQPTPTYLCIFPVFTKFVFFQPTLINFIILLPTHPHQVLYLASHHQLRFLPTHPHQVNLAAMSNPATLGSVTCFASPALFSKSSLSLLHHQHLAHQKPSGNTSLNQSQTGKMFQSNSSQLNVFHLILNLSIKSKCGL